MNRITVHPILGSPRAIEERNHVQFTFNSQRYEGYEGEPIAAALLASGVRVLRRHEESGSPRGIYCAIGHCMECLVQVEGRGSVRACITPLEAGMTVHASTQLANEITGREVERS